MTILNSTLILCNTNIRFLSTFPGLLPSNFQINTNKKWKRDNNKCYFLSKKYVINVILDNYIRNVIQGVRFMYPKVMSSLKSFGDEPIVSITAKKNFFRYYLSSAACVYVCVCVCVFAITATPLHLELSNFGITFLIWISKNSFLKF